MIYEPIDYEKFDGYWPYVQRLRVEKRWGWLLVYRLTGLLQFDVVQAAKHPILTFRCVIHGVRRRARQRIKWLRGVQ